MASANRNMIWNGDGDLLQGTGLTAGWREMSMFNLLRLWDRQDGGGTSTLQAGKEPPPLLRKLQSTMRSYLSLLFSKLDEPGVFWMHSRTFNILPKLWGLALHRVYNSNVFSSHY